jgi:hypothetical protein
MAFAFLWVILGVSLADFFLNGRFTAAGLALLYVALKIQAEYAAQKFIRESAGSLPKQEGIHSSEAEDSYVDVAPLRGKGKAPKENGFANMVQQIEETTKRIFFSSAQQLSGKVPAPNKINPTGSHRTRSYKPSAKKIPKLEPLPFRHPNFRGEPHQTLGIQREAKTRTILKAFRFWIKRFHPDLAGQSQQQARALTEARDRLLSSRKNNAA